MKKKAIWTRTGVLSSALARSLFGVAGTASAATGPVSLTPASGTPQLNETGTTEQVRQLVQCGGTMYAVGSFTSIKKGSTVYTRDNAFSFQATSPYTVSSWNPDVNGTVNSIAFSPDCSTAYLGGVFTSIGGTTVKNIAAVSTSTGAVISTFGHSASGQVSTLLMVNGHLLTGGYFKTINGSSNPYMASLNPATGKDDGFVKLNISGNYSFAPNNPTRVYNQELSHGGTMDLVMGDFTSVGGLQREQIFELDVSGSTAQVTPWTSPEWDGSSSAYPYECATVEPFYIQAASWSPDDSTIYIATTGYHPNVAAAFPATQASVLHTWVNYAGCDSLYSTAADASTAYFGGHERWSMNPNGCDFQGPGAISAPGMEGLSPTTGLLTFNPTRSRGLGADDMLVTSAGLWIASDNDAGSAQCGGVGGHAGICLLPYSG